MKVKKIKVKKTTPMYKKGGTKKSVKETKTKESYKDKASMMKHEGKESMKMKMKEGEMPKMKKTSSKK